MNIDLEYVIMEAKYRKVNKNKNNLFPYEWFYCDDYLLKKKILLECLSNNLLIKESSYYYEFRKKALKIKEKV